MFRADAGEHGHLGVEVWITHSSLIGAKTRVRPLSPQLLWVQLDGPHADVVAVCVCTCTHPHHRSKKLDGSSGSSFLTVSGLWVLICCPVFDGRVRPSHHPVAGTTPRHKAPGEFHLTACGPLNSCTAGEDDAGTVADTYPHETPQVPDPPPMSSTDVRVSPVF